MDGFNSSGRRVSLLVEDGATRDGRSYAKASTTLHSTCSSSDAPELSRSSSFDSEVSQGSDLPLTPESTQNDQATVYAVPALQSPYSVMSDDQNLQSETDGTYLKKAGALELAPLAEPYGPSSTARELVSERKGKRYPCRLAQQYGCDKTFTTSGHASRHSKIHFAVKTIPCSFEGCQKMFTRTDNMKQHLETHYKRGGDKTGRPGPVGHTSSTLKGRVGGQHKTGARVSRGRSASMSLESSDFCTEPRLPVRSAYTRTQSGSSIDGISLATLANAARQVEDM